MENNDDFHVILQLYIQEQELKLKYEVGIKKFYKMVLLLVIC